MRSCDKDDGCGRSDRRYHARGLCQACYMRHKRAGTLDTLKAKPRIPAGKSWRASYDEEQVDHAVVERIINGDWSLQSGPSERIEVCTRWARSGRSLAELARLTGWAIHRYYRLKDAA